MTATRDIQFSQRDIPNGSPVWLDLRRRCEELRSRRSRICRDLPSKDLPFEEQMDRAIVRRITTEAFAVLVKGLNPGRLNDYLAGLRSKVYRDGLTPTEHLLSLFTRVLSSDRSDITTELMDALASVPPETAAPSVLQTIGTAYFEAVRDDPTIAIETAAWLAALQRNDVAERFADFRTSFDASVGAHLEALFSAWGRSLDDEFTWAQVGFALSCVIEGMARRSLVDPEAVPPELPAKVCVQLAFGLTHPSTDD